MPSDPDRPIVLTILPTEILASLLVGELRNEGILAEMTGALTSAFRAEAPGGVRVLVRSSDEEKAREILKAFEKRGQ